MAEHHCTRAFRIHVAFETLRCVPPPLCAHGVVRNKTVGSARSNTAATTTNSRRSDFSNETGCPRRELDENGKEQTWSFDSKD